MAGARGGGGEHEGGRQQNCASAGGETRGAGNQKGVVGGTDMFISDAIFCIVASVMVCEQISN